MGPSVAVTGAVYVVTGNGSPTQTFGYSNSVVELTPDMQVRSFFAPRNWNALDTGDVDLGSVGAVLVQSMERVLTVGKQGWPICFGLISWAALVGRSRAGRFAMERSGARRFREQRSLFRAWTAWSR